MSGRLGLPMADAEIIELVSKDQDDTVRLADQTYGGLSDTMGVFRYRCYEWMSIREEIRPLAPLTHTYETDASLAREMAGRALAQSSMTNLMHLAGSLRAGLVFSAAPVLRVMDELYTDALFIRLDTSGASAIRMLDWQLAETVKVNPQNPVLRDQLATVSAKYERDDHYGKPGSWARLPTGKKYYNFETRKRHVLKELEDENPPVELGAEVWQFIRDEARAQRALTNTTVHASPLAVSTIDDYVAMAIQGALYAVLTVATYRRISDDEILENFPALSAGKDPSLFVRDDIAWRQVNGAALLLGRQVRQTVSDDAS